MKKSYGVTQFHNFAAIILRVENLEDQTNEYYIKLVFLLDTILCIRLFCQSAKALSTRLQTDY